MKHKIRSNLKRLLFCLCDCIFLSGSYVLAILLITYFGFERQGYLSAYLFSIPFQVLGVLLVFIPMGLYRDMLGYISLLEVFRLFVGAALAALVPYFMMGYYMVNHYEAMVLLNPNSPRWPPPK